METLIFGANGQLGQALGETFPDARTIGRAVCDVTNRAQVEAAVSSGAPSVVFNATAYNLVDKAEAEPDQAFAANAWAVGVLSAAARRAGAKFVHYSTDYVFGAGHDRPITEAMPPAPMSVYGRSKLQGEVLALQNNPDALVLRTTGLYSHRRHNFVKAMITHGVAGRPLTVVSDQFVSPTCADSLAKVSAELAEIGVSGVYHVTSQGGCSWFEFAGRIFELLDMKVDLKSIGQAAWGATAARPGYSVLDDEMLRAAQTSRVGRWDDELERFLTKHGAALLAEAGSS